jgi:hypothetical protein
MLACTHDREPFGSAVCVHLRTCRQPWLRYLRWYTGSGLDCELLCAACVAEREQGQTVTAERVCESCFEFATEEVGDLDGIRGKAGIRTRDAPFNPVVRQVALPPALGTIIDIAPVEGTTGRSEWLLLAEDGTLARFDADTETWSRVGSTSLPAEPERRGGSAHVKRSLHASTDGRFAAVVNDHGRHGQVVDATSGETTLNLDCGDYYPETVPFSFSFARVRERLVAIHRTDWNRLDVSDPSTGELLTARQPTSYREGEPRPAHYLDYFHGALHVSPDGQQVLDDGWVWSPVGIPVTWSLERWLLGNPWESEDGPTMRYLCQRSYYWNRAMTWLDEERVAVGGIGDDDEQMLEGVRVFDTSLPSQKRWSQGDVFAFAGPSGTFFSDARWLFSADKTGLSRWDPTDGSRTGHLDGFQPTHHHRATGELIQLVGNQLVRCRSTADSPG